MLIENQPENTPTATDNLPPVPKKRGLKGCLWIYLAVAAVALPLALLRPFPGILLLFLILVGLSLAIIAYEANLNLRTAGANIVNTIRNPQILRQSSESLRPLLLWCAVGLMGLAALGFNPITNPDNGNWQFATRLMLIGAVMLGLALRFWDQRPAMFMPSLTPLTPTRSNAAVASAGVALLLVLAEFNGHLFEIGLPERIPYWVQGLLFYGGIGLLVWGLAGTPRIRPRLSRETLMVIGLFLLSLAIGVWNLENGLRASFDEAISVDALIRILIANGGGLVSPPSTYMTTLVFTQWQTIAVGLFGETVTGLRFASCVVGGLTVVALYYLARDLFDRRTAIIAALLLATFPPHIHFSRIALIHIGDPLFGTLAILFVVRGLKYNRRLDWALAGASLGMTQYFFEAGRLYFVPLVVAWIAVMLFSLRGKLREHQHGLVIMALALLLTALPAFYAFFAQDKSGTNRLGVSSVSGEFWTKPYEDGVVTVEEQDRVLERIFFPFQIYVRVPERAVFYGGNQPLLLVSMVPFFLLGCFYLLWRFNTPAWIVIGWVVSAAVVNIFMRDQAVYARWVVVFPALPLAAAVGLRYVMPALGTTRQQIAWLNQGVLLLAIMIAAGQVYYYHTYHAPMLVRQNSQYKPYPDVVDAGLRASQLPANTDIYLISDPIPDIHPPRNWMRYLSPNYENQRLFVLAASDLTISFLAELPADRNLAFFIDPKDEAGRQLLERSFSLIQSPGPSFPVNPPEKGFVLYLVERR
ncbi:MAG: glycosyltransferase family 39 protein [Anaerolineae bacterium]|nr:glycosyltransferase family 39 protein [Anaerolineae bacterium]